MGHGCEIKPMEMQVILDVFNGEFRTTKHCQHTKIHWQVILILRKLFLTAASIFIINPVTKVLIMILDFNDISFASWLRHSIRESSNEWIRISFVNYAIINSSY